VSGDLTALLGAVEVMDRLRSPGGCPWDAAQTHESLAQYLLEETYETLEAIETGDPQLLREELGDLLLQVLFHARLAEELPAADRFGIDEVAGDLVAKMIRRHPHVFAGAPASADAPKRSADELNTSWEQIKAVEKQRESVTDGVPLAQPALALTAKLISRAQRAGLPVQVEASTMKHGEASPLEDAEAKVGAALFELVRQAVESGVDPESALRAQTHRYRIALREAEA
jgi:XTP/dITP diphosphohydrolase